MDTSTRHGTYDSLSEQVELKIPAYVRVSSSKYLMARLPFLLLSLGAEDIEVQCEGLTLDHQWLLEMLGLPQHAIGAFRADQWRTAMESLSNGLLLERWRSTRTRCPRAMLYAAILTAGTRGFAEIPIPEGCRIPGRSIADLAPLLRRFGIEIEWLEQHLTFTRLPPQANFPLEKVLIPIASNLLFEAAFVAAVAQRRKLVIQASYLGPEIQWFLRTFSVDFLWDENTSLWSVFVDRPTTPGHIVVPADQYEENFWILLALGARRNIAVKKGPSLRPSRLAWPLWNIGASDGDIFVVRGRQHVLLGFDISLGGGGSFLSDDGPSLCAFALTLSQPSSITDLRWPRRLHHVELLHHFGFAVTAAKGVTQIDPHHGALVGGEVDATDIRTGCAVVLATLYYGLDVKLKHSAELERGIAGFWGKLRG